MASELGVYGQEMIGISQVTGIELGRIVLYNIFYELFTVCTSIVVETPGGEIMHARNLDFGLFMGFNRTDFQWEITTLLRPLLVNVNFTSGGQQQYLATHYAGFVGVLSGMKKGAFSVTIDDRFVYKGGYIGILEWLITKKGNWVSMLVRDTLEGQSNFNDAVSMLQDSPLIAPVYFIVGGSGHNQGAVISRSLNESLHYRTLDSDNATNPNGWWVLETNYDWWQQAPFFDNRRGAAVKCVQEMGRDNISPQALFDILSTKPVLNDLTTYSVLMSATTGLFESYLQYCKGLCPLW
jgi:acid ceramidase